MKTKEQYEDEISFIEDKILKLKNILDGSNTDESILSTIRFLNEKLLEKKQIIVSLKQKNHSPLDFTPKYRLYTLYDTDRVNGVINEKKRIHKQAHAYDFKKNNLYSRVVHNGFFKKSDPILNEEWILSILCNNKDMSKNCAPCRKL